jgi:hypothetical protein
MAAPQAPSLKFDYLLLLQRRLTRKCNIISKSVVRLTSRDFSLVKTRKILPHHQTLTLDAQSWQCVVC